MYGSVSDMEYRKLDEKIKRTMKRSAGDMVRLGYLLHDMMEKRLWEEAYDCFDDYLRSELHMEYSQASRFMGIHRKYSVDGGWEVDARWEGYSQSVLVEMLNMPPELEGKVTPDMTARQVREMKRQAREEAAQAEREAAYAEQEAAQAEREAIQAEQWAARQEHEFPGTGQETDVFPGQVCVEEWLASVPEEPTVCGREGTPVPEDSPAELPGQVEVPDAEYREAGVLDGFATSQTGKSPYGLGKTVYPEGSLIAVEGCGHKYHCFSCAQDCGIRQKPRYCVTAPLGTPFYCTTMEFLESLGEGAAAGCQFLHHGLTFHTRGSEEPVPCCRDCGEDCSYRCPRSGDGKAPAPPEPEAGQDDAVTDELAGVRDILRHESRTLDEYLAEGGLPAKLVFRQKTVVAAMAAMVSDLEDMGGETGQDRGTAVQPPFPVLKNNAQRKEWLDGYKSWGLWYRDGNIGVDYYKYDFENGARLVAEVYLVEATKFHDAYESCLLHLVGGPEPPKDRYGTGRWARHERYCRHPNSETELVEFLKEMGKKAKDV